MSRRRPASLPPVPDPVDETARRFVVLCLRSHWEPPALEAARALAEGGGADWDEVARVARNGHVEPLLYCLIRDRDLLPSWLEDQWSGRYYGSAHWSLRSSHWLRQALDRLTALAIPVALLKGAALAETVYPEPVVRPMDDVDLLVRRSDVQQARSALLELGYRDREPELRPGYLLEFRTEETLLIPGEDASLLELHWNVFGPLYYRRVVDTEWFWETSLAVRVQGVPTRMLGPEAQLLHLCGHILHHSGLIDVRLLRLFDVCAVIAANRDRMDWDVLLERAQRYHLVHPTQGILSLVKEEWDVPIPADVLERLRSLRPTGAEERLFSHLSGPRSVLGDAFADLRDTPGWAARLRLLRCLLFPSTEYMQARYRIRHTGLAPLYYPYRWLHKLRGTPG